MESALFGLLFIVSSAGETLAVKALNYSPNPLQLPGYTAFLSNQMWLFMLPIYWFMPNKSWPTATLWLQYIGFGILTFAITLLRNISVNVMPGSVFALLISTSIFFNMVFSGLLLKKTFNLWHVSAAACCVISAFSIGFTAFFSNQEDMPGSNFAIGIPTAFGAAATVALMTVSQEYVQPRWSNLQTRLTEMTIVASLIASALVLVYARLTNELFLWSSDLNQATNNHEGLTLVVGVSVVLPVLKLLVRNTKYSIIQKSNAFFFEFIQALAALTASLASVLIFEEPWSYGFIVAFAMMACSFGLYSWGKLVAASEAKSLPIHETTLNPIIKVKTVDVHAWR
jgi:drug/metabolite transporter (DMT)-like permease